jgi:hypothetical protein
MRTISAVKRVQFVSDRMSYTILRGCWYHIIILNVHAPTENNINDVKDIPSMKKLERVIDKFPKYHTNILLRDFNAKVGGEEIFKLTIEINGDNLNNVRSEASRHFRNKRRKYLKDKINGLATNSKNKNIRDLYRGINEFKSGYQP